MQNFLDSLARRGQLNFEDPARRKIAERLAAIQPSGEYRRFLVTRMGSTGSTWLAKLLNSHPEVFCSHEGVVAKVHPATSYTQDDIVTFISTLAEDLAHGAYRAVGDVGSAWATHLVCLTKGAFTTALLTRHPARILNTRLHVYPVDQSFTAVQPHLLSSIEEVWGIPVENLEPIDKVFLQDICVFVTQLLTMSAFDLWFPIERMQDLPFVKYVLDRLTGLDYDEALIAPLVDARINERTGRRRTIREIVDSFSPRQRDWYRLMLAEIMPYFGYALEDDDLIEPVHPAAWAAAGM